MRTILAFLSHEESLELYQRLNCGLCFAMVVVFGGRLEWKRRVKGEGGDFLSSRFYLGEVAEATKLATAGHYRVHSTNMPCYYII